MTEITPELRAQTQDALVAKEMSFNEVTQTLLSAGLDEDQIDDLISEVTDDEVWECDICSEEYHPEVTRCHICGGEADDVVDEPLPDKIFEDTGETFDEKEAAKGAAVWAGIGAVAIILLLAAYVLFWPGISLSMKVGDAEDLLAEGRHDEAITAFEEAYTYAKDNVSEADSEAVADQLCEAIFQFGEAQADAGRVEEAVNTIKPVARAYPCWSLRDAFETRATEVVRRGGRALATPLVKAEDWDSAAEVYAKHELIEEGVRTLEEKGAFLAAAQLADKGELTEDAARLYESAKAWEKAGDRRGALGENTKAAELYDKAEQWDKAGFAHLGAEPANIDAAVASFLRGELWDEAASAYVQGERIDEASAVYQKREDWANAARVYEEAGQREKAIESFEKGGLMRDVARLHEDTDKARAIEIYSAAEAWEDVARLHEADNELVKAAQVLTEHKKWSALGHLNLRSGEQDEALKAFEEAEDWGMMAAIHADREAYDTSHELYVKAEEWGPARTALLRHIDGMFSEADCEDPAMIDQLARCNMELEKYDEAYDTFLTLGDIQMMAYALAMKARFDPGIRIRMEAARAFGKAGDSSAERVFYEEALALAKTHVNHTRVLEVSAALERLPEGMAFSSEVIDKLLENAEAHAAQAALKQVLEFAVANEAVVARQLLGTPEGTEAFDRLMGLSDKVEALSASYPELEIKGVNQSDSEGFSGTYFEGTLTNTTDTPIASVTIRIELFEKDMSLCSSRKCRSAPAGYQDEITVVGIPAKGEKPFTRVFSNRAAYSMFSHTLVKLRFE